MPWMTFEELKRDHDELKRDHERLRVLVEALAEKFLCHRHRTHVGLSGISDTPLEWKALEAIQRSTPATPSSRTPAAQPPAAEEP